MHGNDQQYILLDDFLIRSNVLKPGIQTSQAAQTTFLQRSRFRPGASCNHWCQNNKARYRCNVLALCFATLVTKDSSIVACVPTLACDEIAGAKSIATTFLKYPFSYIPLCFACCNKSLGENGNAQHCRLRSSKQRKRQSCTVPFSSRTLFVTSGSQRKKDLAKQIYQKHCLDTELFFLLAIVLQFVPGRKRHCYDNVVCVASLVQNTCNVPAHCQNNRNVQSNCQFFVKGFFAIHEICGQNLRYKVYYKRHYWRKRQRPTKTLSFAEKHVLLASLDALGTTTPPLIATPPPAPKARPTEPDVQDHRIVPAPAIAPPHQLQSSTTTNTPTTIQDSKITFPSTFWTFPSPSQISSTCSSTSFLLSLVIDHPQNTPRTAEPHPHTDEDHHHDDALRWFLDVIDLTHAHAPRHHVTDPEAVKSYFDQLQTHPIRPTSPLPTLMTPGAHGTTAITPTTYHHHTARPNSPADPPPPEPTTNPPAHTSAPLGVVSFRVPDGDSEI